jgi:septum formation topological specificity factor MinE
MTKRPSPYHDPAFLADQIKTHDEIHRMTRERLQLVIKTIDRGKGHPGMSKMILKDVRQQIMRILAAYYSQPHFER